MVHRWTLLALAFAYRYLSPDTSDQQLYAELRAKLRALQQSSAEDEDITDRLYEVARWVRDTVPAVSEQNRPDV